MPATHIRAAPAVRGRSPVVYRPVAATQIGILDLIKAVACNLIVLHHLAFYGPMADQARLLAPGLFDWLDGQARIAVHAFLAVGGFLAAKSLSQAGAFAPGLLSVVLRRFARLRRRSWWPCSWRWRLRRWPRCG